MTHATVFGHDREPDQSHGSFAGQFGFTRERLKLLDRLY
jgi:hypothetical protein